MRAKFFRIHPAMLVAGAVIAATASAQCPSSQIFTNTMGDAFSAVVNYSAGPLYRKDGGGLGDFGPWILTESGSGSGGWFTQNSSGNGGGSDGNHIGYSWGLWANSGELVSATRVLGPTNTSVNDFEASGDGGLMVLPVGVAFEIDIDNGYVSSGSSTGIGLQNAEGQTLWEWYFPGGEPYYVYHDNSGYNYSSLGWTDQGMHIAFTLTSSNTYSATITPVSGSGSITVSGTVISNTDYGVVQARSWNYSAGSGSAYDFFVNNINIIDKSDNAFTSTYLSPRSWISGDGSGWDLYTTGTNAGFYIGTGGGAIGAGATPNTASWNLYANSGDVADAIRPFGQPVYVSNSVFVGIQNGYVGSGGTVGVGLQSGATNRFEFYFAGGGSDYLINDGSGAGRDTGIGWTTFSLLLQFTLTSSNTYSLIVTPGAGTNIETTLTGSLEGVSNTLIDRVRLFNVNSGAGSSYDFNCTFLAIGTSPTSIPPGVEYPLFGETVTGSIKYDQSNFMGSLGGSWVSGQDNGYSILSIAPFVPLNIPTAYYGDALDYTGGKEIQGCYDGCGSTPWFIKIVN